MSDTPERTEYRQGLEEPGETLTRLHTIYQESGTRPIHNTQPAIRPDPVANELMIRRILAALKNAE